MCKVETAGNGWTGVNFGLGVTSWGAVPGHTRDDIVSGVGVVHNALLLDHPGGAEIDAEHLPQRAIVDLLEDLLHALPFPES